MSGTLGVNKGFPCLICLIPKHEQPNLGSSWPQFTPELTLVTIKEASRQKSKKHSKNILKKQSLCQIDVNDAHKFNCTSTYELTFAEYISELFLSIYIYLPSLHSRPTPCN